MGPAKLAGKTLNMKRNAGAVASVAMSRYPMAWVGANV
jgi:hypothetical protein